MVATCKETCSPGSTCCETRKTPLPVTVVNGTPSSGKTSLLQHIAQSADGLRIALLINNGISENSVESNASSSDWASVLVRLEDGCICCTSRDTLIDELLKLSGNPAIDYCVVESAGVCDPTAIAEVFECIIKDSEESSNESGDDIPLSKLVCLDNMVTVLDANNFSSYLSLRETAVQQWGSGFVHESEQRVAEVLANQLEFANVIVVNKCDLVTKSESQRVCSAIRAFNSNAKVFETSHSKVDCKRIIGTETFTFENTIAGKRWLLELRDIEEETASNENLTNSVSPHHVSSLVYRRRRPFDPKRFAAAAVQLARMGNTILRSCGFVWLATKNEGYAEWSQTGVVWSLNPGGLWLCATPREQWPSESEEFLENLQKDMHPDPMIGDRRQELVFLGQAMESERISSLLDECLLSTEEMKSGAEAWKELDDPFGIWDFSDDVDEEQEHDTDENRTPSNSKKCKCCKSGGGKTEEVVCVQDGILEKTVHESEAKRNPILSEKRAANESVPAEVDRPGKKKKTM